MLDGLLGKKLGMTQVFDPTGRALAVTVIETGPCVVTQLRTQENGRLQRRAARLRHRKAAEQAGGGPSPGERRELALCPRDPHRRQWRPDGRPDGDGGCRLQAGRPVDVTGQSKGKGFQGVVKRHHFAGGPKTHGQSDRHRAPGSIGAGTTPGRVFKGQKMAGHMGNERVTVQNCALWMWISERNLVLDRGRGAGREWRARNDPPDHQEPPERASVGHKGRGLADGGFGLQRHRRNSRHGGAGRRALRDHAEYGRDAPGARTPAGERAARYA